MNSLNILVVEDETIVALDIKDAIVEMGHTCLATVTNYDEVLSALKENIPDIILMDINLEDSINGIEIVNKLQEDYSIPFIYLTAYTDEFTIKKAIETKPVGYIVKPYKIAELKATILLGSYKINSNKNIENNYIQIGDGYYFDEENVQLFYKQMPVKLSKKESSLLKLLIEARGSIVSFKDIEYNLWDTVVSDATLRVLIFRLRAKLEHKFIETVSAFGCRINLS
ncbi:response regulator [Halarcobacter sp.]|uniref:response regulator n=1 Tax=Halarcobacter sp. TaxID=2321133 RepID=UPI002AABF970|nr:response regulator [Halarcobacter sp.]